MRVQVGFLLLALIWKFDFSPFMVLIIAILNDGKDVCVQNYDSKQKLRPYACTCECQNTSAMLPDVIVQYTKIVIIVLAGTIMTISKDRVKPSPLPDSWKLKEIFATGIVLGTYLALMTVLFFWAAHRTDFFPVSTSYSMACWGFKCLLRLE